MGVATIMEIIALLSLKHSYSSVGVGTEGGELL